jgi:hypothetical protein
MGPIEDIMDILYVLYNTKTKTPSHCQKNTIHTEKPNAVKNTKSPVYQYNMTTDRWHCSIKMSYI